MTARNLVIALVVLLAAAITWRYRNSELIQDLVNPQQHKPVRIEFDNGTVREYASPASASRKAGAAPMRVGSLRKCQKAGEITYTNTYCPPGAKEMPLTQGTVNVVETPAPKPAGSVLPLQTPSPASPGDAVRKQEPGLRERAVDAAVNR